MREGTVPHLEPLFIGIIGAVLWPLLCVCGSVDVVRQIEHTSVDFS